MSKAVASGLGKIRQDGMPKHMHLSKQNVRFLMEFENGGFGRGMRWFWQRDEVVLAEGSFWQRDETKF